MAKFDKKQFASALAEAVLKMKCDNLASTDREPTYNEETGEFTLNMRGYEDSNDFGSSLSRARQGKKYVPEVIFRMTFKVDMLPDPDDDPEDWI